MQGDSLMAPVYAGYDNKGKNSKGKRSGADKKQSKKGYDNATRELLKDLGIEDDEQFLFTPMPGGMYGATPRGRGLDYLLPAAPPVMPRGGAYGRMQQGMMPGYSPMIHQTGGPQAMPGGYGGAAHINIQYTAPDGTMYQMGVVSSPENRGKALYNVLNGLYGLMTAEGKTGQYGKSSGSGSKGAGGRSGGK